VGASEAAVPVGDQIMPAFEIEAVTIAALKAAAREDARKGLFATQSGINEVVIETGKEALRKVRKQEKMQQQR
jgi:hypothetical protein